MEQFLKYIFSLINSILEKDNESNLLSLALLFENFLEIKI